MKVSLIACTTDALDVLLFTKSTRLTMSPEGLDAVRAMTPERKAEELRYMRNTIQSSWEFVDYIFAIEGVTRAFTHQLVRHRVGTSFAQQAQRVVNMQGFDYLATGDVTGGLPDHAKHTDGVNDYVSVDLTHSSDSELYEQGMDAINVVYTAMTKRGVKPQDARGILPTNVLTNIVFKANLRTLHDMALKRLCVKAQGEFQDVFDGIVAAVVAEHPWAGDFLKVQCAWNGTCLFPSLPVEQCHVKRHVYDPTTQQSYGMAASLPGNNTLLGLDQLYQLHRSVRTEIQPIVPGSGWEASS